MTHTHESLFIGGRWQQPATTCRIEVISASTEEPLGGVPEASAADVDAAVAAARHAFIDPTGWASWSADRRAAALERLAAAVEKRGEQFAQLVSSQNGMPISIGRATETVWGPMLLRYYAGLARQTPAEETRVALLGGNTVVRREPFGVVAVIVPWNFPQALTFFKLAPALAAGCTVVVKPAPETVLDAYLLAEAVIEADLPPGVVNIVPGGAETGTALVRHPDIDKVAFTGSTATGRTIAEECARLLRPVTLELGGKSAAIVLDDADLPALLEEFFAATLLNNGQTCYLGTRILAPRNRYRTVVDTLTGFAAALTVGDPLDETTQIGPLVSRRQRDRVEGYIAKGRAEGARLTTGGGRPADLDRGWYVEPTIFADVDNSATIAREEIFGPVLSIIGYDDLDQAVAIANDSDYGLGGTVWTADPERGMEVARRIETGSIGINCYTLDPCSPFGGVKASGMGRELGPEGLAAFQQLKSIYLPQENTP
ncbi:MAG: aldA 3 [Nocardia sp.]|uniref:aldehyde dehydrogenase n=1 Tax=Nocardia sp. TaxID=1821 RepID=UPI002615DE6F|nr:aldehyde dehydrogenase [Nocardia sp.]MCU1639981.1 aldA 3 [Nocardia sp.]